MNNVIVPRQLNMDHHQASIDLVFDDQTSQAIRDLSIQMGLAFGEFIPHATLVNIPSKPFAHLAEVAAQLPRQINIQLAGVAVVPDFNDGVFWIEISVLKTAELARPCAPAAARSAAGCCQPGAECGCLAAARYDWLRHL